MKLSEAFPSDYLKASDLNGNSVTVRISKVEMVEMGQGNKKENKLLISFHGSKKQLVCNKTNAGTIEKLYGDDTDLWVGKPVTLTAREVEYQGDVVMGIRVSLQKPAQPAIATPPAHKPQPAVVEPAFSSESESEDVPF